MTKARVTRVSLIEERTFIGMSHGYCKEIRCKNKETRCEHEERRFQDN